MCTCRVRPAPGPGCSAPTKHVPVALSVTSGWQPRIHMLLERSQSQEQLPHYAQGVVQPSAPSPGLRGRLVHAVQHPADAPDQGELVHVCCSRLQLGQLLVGLLSEGRVLEEGVGGRAVSGLSLVQLCTPPFVSVTAMLCSTTRLSASLKKRDYLQVSLYALASEGCKPAIRTCQLRRQRPRGMGTTGCARRSLCAPDRTSE